jgi:hypothetical protein
MQGTLWRLESMAFVFWLNLSAENRKFSPKTELCKFKGIIAKYNEIHNALDALKIKFYEECIRNESIVATYRSGDQVLSSQ